MFKLNHGVLAVNCSVLGVVTASLSTPSLAQTVVLRVDGDAGDVPPNADGSAWGPLAFAFLQDALAEAEIRLAGGATSVQIWVAATDPSNPYRPDQGAGQMAGDRSASFELVQFVEIYGGFVGMDHLTLPEGETFLHERDVLLHETALSGVLTVPEPPEACIEAEGDCYGEHATPGCDDPVCCAVVCNMEPFCCDVQWDSNCAQAAVANCGEGLAFHEGSRVQRQPNRTSRRFHDHRRQRQRIGR